MKLSWPAPNRRFGVLDGLGLAGMVGLAVARWVPIARLPFWGCSIREATGWPCLGCGLTRAADHFSHGNVLAALQANPLGTVAAAIFAVLAVATALHLVFAMPLPELHLTRREANMVRGAVALLVLLNWVFVAISMRAPQLLS